MEKEFSRAERVSPLLQRHLMEFMKLHLRDPRLPDFLTISAVNLSPDLKNAKVYMSLQGEPTQINETLVILNKAAGHLRHLLAGAINLRVTPKLRFVHDVSIQTGSHLSNLIDAAIDKDC